MTAHRLRVVVGLALIPSVAIASPNFSIGEGGDTSWSDALSSGLIRSVDPMDGLTGAAESFYGQQGTYALVPSVLTPNIDTTFAGETHDSLVMSWNPDPGGADLAIAAWEYTYPEDPDLSAPNTKVHFSLGVPGDQNNPGQPAIWDVSIELIDNAGLARGWFLSMPPVGWSQWWLDVNQLGGQQGWGMFEDPGFDITSVVGIRLDEASSMSPVFPLSPPGTPQQFWDWNAWDSLRVTPTPGTSMLLAVAGVGLLRRRR